MPLGAPLYLPRYLPLLQNRPALGFSDVEDGCTEVRRRALRATFQRATLTSSSWGLLTTRRSLLAPPLRRHRLVLLLLLQALALKPGDCTGKELKLKFAKFQAVSHLFIFVDNEGGDRTALTRMTFIGTSCGVARQELLGGGDAKRSPLARLLLYPARACRPDGRVHGPP